jgi:hypothetical protein
MNKIVMKLRVMFSERLSYPMRDISETGADDVRAGSGPDGNMLHPST